MYKAKRFIILFLSIFIMFSLLSSVAYASGSNDSNIVQTTAYAADGNIVRIVEKANAEIQNAIDQANAQAEKAIAESERRIQEEYAKAEGQGEKSEVTLAKVEKIKADLEKRLDEIIRKLIEKTDRIAADAIKKAAKYGITLIPRYIEVKIGDRTVLVDPFWVY